jgi:PST family polysaccharide transporter
MGANLVRGKLAALFLGPAGVGVFNQLALMWNLFQVSGSLGAFNGLVQHGTEAMVAKDDLALRRLASTWWILLTVFSCLLAAAGALVSKSISNWLLGDHGAHAGVVALMLVSIPFAVSAQVYRALLSAARAIPRLVRAQIFSDAGGAVVFAALIPVLGLPGAIIGFATIHLLFYIVTALSVRKMLGRDFVRPKLRDFRWSLVRSNAGFGASGLAMITLSNLSVVVVSRILISHQGLEANGMFSNAWRIASVYLGAITTTTVSYVLPTLTRANDDRQMSARLNAMLRFYLVALPPLMVAIMAGGKVLVWLILSSRFEPVAMLLLVFVPAEMFRVLGETMTVPLLARRRTGLFTLMYFIQASVFVVAAVLLVPERGALGGAMAYMISTVTGALFDLSAATRVAGFRVERQTAWLALPSIALLGGSSLACFALQSEVARVVACLALVACWFAVNMQNVEFARLVQRALHAVRPALR